MRILAIKWRRLGDTVLWTSALGALRAHYPEAEIDIAFPEEYAALFSHDTRFQESLPLRRSSLRETQRRIRQRHYDMALNFHASERSAWLVLLSGAKERLIHHSRKPKRFFSTKEIPSLGVPMKATERDPRSVQHWGGTGPLPPRGSSRRAHCPLPPRGRSC